MNNQIELLPQEITQKTTKKEIVTIAELKVSEMVEGGYANTIEELVTAIRVQTYAEAIVKALRPHAAKEMREDKETVVLGAKVSKQTESGRWQFDDDYINRLEEELKVVKEKSKNKEKKNRLHVTLEGEEVTISPALHVGGGDLTIKITL